MENNERKLQVKIITPEGITYQNQANTVVAPAVSGTVGILPHHMPLFTKLEVGEVKIKTTNGEEFFAVTGGFMDVSSDGVVTILTDSAQRSHEIDVQAAQKAREAAQKALENREKLSAVEFARAESALRKAILDLKISQKRKAQKKPF